MIKYLTFFICGLVLIVSLTHQESSHRKSVTFLDYLALEPGADIPVIPGPSGTGIQGLYRSMGLENKHLRNASFQEPEDLSPGERTEPEKNTPSREPEIKIPFPVSPEGRERKFKITTHRLNIQEEDPRIPAGSTDLNQNDEESRDKEDEKNKLKNDSRVTGLPSNLTPTPRTGFQSASPEYYRGIYLNNQTIRKSSGYEALLKKAADHGINVLVVDVQPRMPSSEFIKRAEKSGFYLVSRVVVFEGGLKEYPPPMRHLNKIADTAEASVKLGFKEVQLDYIRFADNMNGFSLPLEKRYRLISGILKMVTDRLRPYGARVGADVFGRIAFNRDDVIGQKLEIFSPHLDTIYPMLYPSHFYGDPDRIRNPYKTIFEGTRSSMDRVTHSTKVIAYIQVFKMSVPKSGLSYKEYIAAQIRGANDSKGGGYIAWNAKNDYNTLFEAISHLKK